jgi:hypothetical protein
MDKFLEREIKLSNKGLFINYGPIRFIPKEKTRLKVNDTVFIFPIDYKALVFPSIEGYEIWFSPGLLKEHLKKREGL